MSQVERRARRAGRVVLKLYDEMAPHASALAIQARITCKDGCSHCCMLPATATIPEMIPIVEYMTGRPDWSSRKPTLERELDRHLREFAGVDVLDEQSRVSFFTRQLPCVFLKDHRCEVYAVRPAVCRYHMVTSPSDNCAIGAPGNSMVRVDVSKFERVIALSGARELGELYGATIAVAFILAADQIGIRLKVDRAMLDRCMITRMSMPGAAR